MRSGTFLQRLLRIVLLTLMAAALSATGCGTGKPVPAATGDEVDPAIRAAWDALTPQQAAAFKSFTNTDPSNPYSMRMAQRFWLLGAIGAVELAVRITPAVDDPAYGVPPTLPAVREELLFWPVDPITGQDWQVRLDTPTTDTPAVWPAVDQHGGMTKFGLGSWDPNPIDQYHQDGDAETLAAYRQTWGEQRHGQHWLSRAHAPICGAIGKYAEHFEVLPQTPSAALHWMGLRQQDAPWQAFLAAYPQARLLRDPDPAIRRYALLLDGGTEGRFLSIENIDAPDVFSRYRSMGQFEWDEPAIDAELESFVDWITLADLHASMTADSKTP